MATFLLQYKKILFVLMTFFIALPANGQITSAGQEFWFNFLANYQQSGRVYELKVFISSDVNASGTVSVPGRSWSQNFNVPANSTVTITVPTSVGHVTIGDAISDQGIHITSDNDINVFAMNYSNQTTDGSLILPTSALGKSYAILTYDPISGCNSEFSIVATENNTSVRIIPSQATTGGHAAGTGYTVTLGQGQVYQVQSSKDLTGSRVYSLNNKNIAVFAGAECVNIPPGNPTCDHLFEQMYPINTLRRNFVAIPFKTRKNGDTYRVLATRNGTTVTFDGGSAINLNAYQWQEFKLSQATYISSNYPVAIAQYSNGYTYDSVTEADPFFIMLSPVEQTREDITFEEFTSSTITGNYLNIAAKTSCRDNVKLDGNAVTGWAVLPGNPAYSYVQMSVTQGAHRLTSIKDCGFNAYVYGYGPYDSYGYSAGVRLDTLAINVTTNTDCAGSATEFYVSSYPYPIINYFWQFGDGASSQVERPTHIYQSGGRYQVTLYVTYDNNDKDTVIQQFDIAEPKAKIKYSGGQCGNLSVQFTDNSTVIGGVLSSWRWDFGDGDETNDRNPSHTYSHYGTFRVILRVMTKNGCTDYDTVEIKVTPPVQTNAKKYYEMCFGESVRIGGDTVTGTAPFTFEWSPSDYLSSDTEARPIASPPNNITYIVKITDSENCSTIDTMTVLVNPLPIFDLGKDVETCLNVPIDIGAQVSSGTRPYFYKWTPATGLSATDRATVTATPQQTTKYYLTVTDSKGCHTTDSITVVILPLPEPRIKPEGPIEICSCDSVLLDAGNGYIDYQWSNGDTTQTTIIKTTGDYTVTVTDTNGCINTSPAVTVNVTYPQATVTLGSPSYQVRPGQIIKIPIYISQSAYLDFCNSHNWVMDLSFKKYIMVPAGNTPAGVFDNDLRRIQLSGTRNSNSDTLLLLDFMGTLGDVINSTITIDSFNWTDCNFNSDIINSDVALTGLCQEGGTTRLFSSPKAVSLFVISPNPADGETKIIYSLSEDSAIKIFMTNITAGINTTLLEGFTKKGKHELILDVGNLPNGSYLIGIQAPDGSVSTLMEVLK